MDKDMLYKIHTKFWDKNITFMPQIGRLYSLYLDLD